MSRKKKTSTGLTATKMRVVLLVSLVLAISGMATGFYFAYLSLQKASDEVASIQATANSEDATVQNMMQTKKDLAKYADTVERAKNIVAESQSYRYQDQVVRDISEYANRAGVPLASIGFQAESGDSSAAASGTNTPPAAEGSTAEGTDAPAAASGGASMKNTTVSVTLAQNISYANFLHFIHLIEESLTRMQITQISIARGDSPDTITAQTLNIEVYIK